MLKDKKGFTLIELLVVIAIIGILSSVVLASLNSARAKGKDAAIKSQLNSLRAQMSLYADGRADVSAFFTADPQAVKLLAGIVAQGSTVALSTTTANLAAASLLSTGESFCVDSGGIATTTAYTPASSAIAGGLCK
jgi:type IV pilus assembly protein PilA